MTCPAALPENARTCSWFMRMHSSLLSRHMPMISAFFLLLLLLTGTACQKSKVDTNEYIGDYSYDAPLTAMVYENFEGEGMGIVYREVTDYDKLIGYTEVPVLLYFYSSLQPDGGDATAFVEQLAENYHDKILVVSADTLQATDLASHFDIETTPDFILLQNGSLTASFDGFGGNAWTESDLENWILDNSGIR